jgi:hypothetical protein
MFNKSPK